MWPSGDLNLNLPSPNSNTLITALLFLQGKILYRQRLGNVLALVNLKGTATLNVLVCIFKYISIYLKSVIHKRKRLSCLQKDNQFQLVGGPAPRSLQMG